MRCPDCNKFVPLTEPESDNTDDPNVTVDKDPETGKQSVMIEVSAHITRACEECGTELKEAQFDLTSDPIDVPDGHPDGEDVHDIEAEVVSDEATSRFVGKGRYTQSFYGVALSVEVKCACGGWSATVELSDDVAASGMDEMV